MEKSIRFLIVTGLLLTSTGVCNPIVGDRTTVDLGYSKYQGVSNSTLGTVTFWGLPFAAPPTGDLRWRAPVPIESSPSSPDVVDATKPGVQCIQGSAPGVPDATNNLDASALNITVATGQESSEDCLRLDVVVPQNPKSSSLPVVVAIHGGGYVSGNSQAFPGQYFVKQAEGSLLFVSIQYRLGAYGFLGGSTLRNDGALNVALLDQRLALEWVQRHIGAFGGDPKKVTIWGQSAGGGSVANQLMLHGGQENPPFRAAIAEFPGFSPYKSEDALETQYRELLTASGCKDLKCLRGLSSSNLKNAVQKANQLGLENKHYAGLQPYYSPYVDGKVILDIPSMAFNGGAWSKVPFITTHNAFEGTIFTNSSISSEAAIRSELALFFQVDKSGPLVNKITAAYPWIKFAVGSYFNHPFFESSTYKLLGLLFKWNKLNIAFWQAQETVSDALFKCPTYYFNTAATKAQVPSWKLDFEAAYYLHGASSIYLVFDPAMAGNQTLATWMKDYFISFVVELNPNTWSRTKQNQRPMWPEYGTKSAQGKNVLQVNDTSVAVQSDPDANDRCGLWLSQADTVNI